MKLIGAFSEIEKCLDRLSVLSMPCFFCLGCDRQQSCQVYYWRPECAQKHIKTLDTIINHMNDAVVLIVKKSKLPQDDLTELVSLASQLGKDFGVISLSIRHQGSLSQAQCEKKREAYEYAHISLHGGTLKLRNGLQEIITKCKSRLVVANITNKNPSSVKPRKTTTLAEFLEFYCGVDKIAVDRAKNNIKQACKDKKITLPDTANQWTTGKTKIYFVSDLKKNWPLYRLEIPTLPQLKTKVGE